MPSLLVVPIPPIDGGLLLDLLEPLGTAFGAPVILDSGPLPDARHALDPVRRQHHATALLSSLLDVHQSIDGKILGVTSLDLFVPVLTYVFGEAQLDGKAAVVSTFRLDDSVYGLPPDPRRLKERLLKEAVHELGHTYGLIHCRDYQCVMHSSTSVEEIDIKGEQLCPTCAGAIGLTTGS